MKVSKTAAATARRLFGLCQTGGKLDDAKLRAAVASLVASKPRDYRDTLRADATRYAAFRLALLHRGLYVLPDGRWYVGAVHGEPELAHALAAIDAALGDLAESTP